MALNVASWGVSVRSTASVSILVVMLAACQLGPTDNPSTDSPGSQAASSPSVPASPLASPSASMIPFGSASPFPSLSSNWEPMTIEAGHGAPLTSVAWTGTRFLAVDGVDGELLASADGRAWQLQPRLDDGSVRQVAAGPQGVLAVGSINAEGVVAIWHSTDGLNWTATPDSASLHGRDGAFLTMAAVASADHDWLAVGGEHLNCVPAACALVRAVSWTSPDATAWSRGEDSVAMQHAEMNGLVHVAPGYVAVGGALADPALANSPIRPAVWTSPDGRRWTRSTGVPLIEAGAAANASLDSVAMAGGRVVAVGHVDPSAGAASTAFAWWSDGDTWSMVTLGRFILSQQVRIVATPGGFLAMFGFGSDSTCASAIWSSRDGSSWSCIGNDRVFAGAAVSDGAVAPQVEVLVGSGTDGAVVWTSAPH